MKLSIQNVSWQLLRFTHICRSSFSTPQGAHGRFHGVLLRGPLESHAGVLVAIPSFGKIALNDLHSWSMEAETRVIKALLNPN